MSDKELLELAAKAGKYELLQFERSDGCFEDSFRTKDGYWNPLLNDGDALRLAVELGMRVEIDIECEDVCTYIYAQDGKRVSACENFSVSKDTYSATRRAIVMVAAEFGKGML